MKVTMIVEWPKGTRVRWEWNGQMFVRKREDAPAPVNYGFIPNTQNPADDSEVDAVLLGLPRPAGQRLEAEIVGMIRLADGDHKLILTPPGTRPDEAEINAALAWFPAARKPEVAGKEEALGWLSAHSR